MGKRLGIVTLGLAALLLFGCEHYQRRHRRARPGPVIFYPWARHGDDDHDRDRDRDRHRRRDHDDHDHHDDHGDHNRRHGHHD